MRNLLWFGAGFLLALSFVGALTFGIERGKLDVISACRFYGRYGIDGTEVMYCNLDPDPMTIKIIQGKKK